VGVVGTKFSAGAH